MTPSFPMALDSTILATFRSCPQKAFREYFEHWKPKAPNVHLHAGAAFASALEASRRAFYEEGICEEDSMLAGMEELARAYGDFECPPDSAKSLPRLLGALEFYFANYPLSDDAVVPIQLPWGKRAIEFTFAIPLPISHPETGEPILYTGRSDMIASFCGGNYIFDDKTTSSLGASWAKQWELRSQFTGYSWAAREAGIDITGVIVRGVSILKTKYETQQAISARPDWQIQRWLQQTLYDIQRMISAWKSGWFDFNLDHACTEYGGCPLQRICSSPNPEEWLGMYFERRVWDPLSRTETLLEAA